MHNAPPLAVLFDQFKRDIIILIPDKTRAQAVDLSRKRKPHLNAGIATFKVRFIIIQHRLNHIETERALGMAVKAANDSGHVNALFARSQTDRARHRCLECKITSVTGVELDGQAKIGNTDMLNLALRASDQRTGSVLQIRQSSLIS